MKVKIFATYFDDDDENQKDLEGEMNKWLSKHSDIQVDKVLSCSGDNSSIWILLFYTPKVSLI